MLETSANNNAIKLIRNVKVYKDGSSFIAIPHTAKPKGKTKRHSFDPNKQDFEKAYAEVKELPKKERKQAIIEKLNDIVPNAKEYVDISLERKNKNRTAKRTRLWRKARLQRWNYFCTFTYSDKLHTEETFKKQLKYTLWNLTKRKDWQYAGVWERAPVTGRLHFHGIFDIPDGTMPGELVEVSDWDSKNKRRQTTIQNTYFNEKFGRSDFELITSQETLGNSLAYILKYIEKTGERIVCSKGLSAYFISDIREDDILCNISDEDKPAKYLLFDDFACHDEGLYMGQVSDAVIAQMRKSN